MWEKKCYWLSTCYSLDVNINVNKKYTIEPLSVTPHVRDLSTRTPITNINVGRAAKKGCFIVNASIRLVIGRNWKQV